MHERLVLRPLVLVVDDNPDHRTIASICLHEHGYRVREAVDGLDALEKIAELGPDLVLMDVSMPRMSGWEATRLIRANPSTRGIPVIAMTALSETDVVDAAFDAGCDGFLIKPCRSDLLHSTIAAHLRAQRRI